MSILSRGASLVLRASAGLCTAEVLITRPRFKTQASPYTRRPNQHQSPNLLSGAERRVLYKTFTPCFSGRRLLRRFQIGGYATFFFHSCVTCRDARFTFSLAPPPKKKQKEEEEVENAVLGTFWFTCTSRSVQSTLKGVDYVAVSILVFNST